MALAPGIAPDQELADGRAGSLDNLCLLLLHHGQPDLLLLELAGKGALGGLRDKEDRDWGQRLVSVSSPCPSLASVLHSGLLLWRAFKPRGFTNKFLSPLLHRTLSRALVNAAPCLFQVLFTFKG